MTLNANDQSRGVSWRRLLAVATCLSARCRSRVMMSVTDELRSACPWWFVARMFLGVGQVSARRREEAVGVPRRVVVCTMQCAAGGIEFRRWRGAVSRVWSRQMASPVTVGGGLNEVTAGLPSVCVGGAAVA